MRQNTSPEQRRKRCIMLNYWTVKDISILLDMSPSTLKTRIQKGALQASYNANATKSPIYCTTAQVKSFIKSEFGDAPILKML